jgi:hypothetical protein
VIFLKFFLKFMEQTPYREAAVNVLRHGREGDLKIFGEGYFPGRRA